MRGVSIRPYRPDDERGWVVCRVLSFLDSAFFDDVRREKEHYANPAIELVAEHAGEIVGLLDVECELEPGTVGEKRPGLGGMIWQLAVYPDHQRRGVGSALLREAETRAREHGLARLEAWTRDDEHVRLWYEACGFELIYVYLHVYVELDEGLRNLFPVTPDGIRPMRLFAHYVGDRPDDVRRRFARVHEDVLYELSLS
jgi:ribosomal protein S18 acetylase RimI-like enzyme